MEIEYFVLILYDWLEECVESLVLPEKIIKMFRQKIDSTFLEKHIINYKNVAEGQKKEILDKFKSNFSKKQEISMCDPRLEESANCLNKETNLKKIKKEDRQCIFHQ